MRQVKFYQYLTDKCCCAGVERWTVNTAGEKGVQTPDPVHTIRARDEYGEAALCVSVAGMDGLLTA